MMEGQDLDRLNSAYGPEFRYHDENLAMLGWYVDRMMGALTRENARTLISLGIGHGVVGRAILSGLAPRLAEYTVVEGSPEAVTAFRAATAVPSNVRLVNAFFEEYDPGRAVDAVEMGFVLEHVDDPAAVLDRYARFLRPGGTMVVVVPNARALHRRFGHAAGLLDDLFRLSADDLLLGHKRYFDLASITALVAAAGLEVKRVEGVYLKCLTTAQLRALSLPPEVRRAFFTEGVDHPALCNAIYIEAVR
jgi:SAM-dependent methyltransferase